MIATSSVHKTTINLPEDLWEEVQEMAARRGIKASHFIREATHASVVYHRGRDGEYTRALAAARKRFAHETEKTPAD
jgi:metal-responsive CopG/Arc/MetJ family transcriptional regulator